MPHAWAPRGDISNREALDGRVLKYQGRCPRYYSKQTSERPKVFVILRAQLGWARQRNSCETLGNSLNRSEPLFSHQKMEGHNSNPHRVVSNEWDKVYEGALRRAICSITTLWHSRLKFFEGLYFNTVSKMKNSTWSLKYWTSSLLKQTTA